MLYIDSDPAVGLDEPPITASETLWPLPLLNWPEDAERNALLADERRPRLLLVAPGAEPPVDLDGTSDWVRRPATARDVYARIEALQRRAERPTQVHLDDNALLWRRRSWVALAPVEARLIRALLDRAGGVVSPADLLAAGWPSARIAVNALHPRLSRLRGRIAPLGLTIDNVRQRGYTLTVLEER